MEISRTPKPPYYAVIFTSVRTPVDEGYAEMSDKLDELVLLQPGFLGYESAREPIGITVSYWADLESVHQWKETALHVAARTLGREKWYKTFRVRIARIEKEYGTDGKST